MNQYNGLFSPKYHDICGWKRIIVGRHQIIVFLIDLISDSLSICQLLEPETNISGKSYE